MSPFSEQTPSAPGGGCGYPRGRKLGGLRNRTKMVGTGRNGWRTHTMGLGGGPQGSNLFPQAGRLSSSRKVSFRQGGNKVARNFSADIWQLSPTKDVTLSLIYFWILPALQGPSQLLPDRDIFLMTFLTPVWPSRFYR